jgi:hypothetical protein
MERELRIFETSDAANPTSLVRSRLLQDRLLPEYAATRARCAVSLKSMSHSNDDLWSFVMIPDTPMVVGLFPRLKFLCRVGVGIDNFRQQRVSVQAARSDRPTPRTQSVARTAQLREQERAARVKERRLRRRERREQYSEEYQLREQQGFSPPGTPAGSSSEEEEEESDGGQPPREVESPSPITTGRGGGCEGGACGGRGGARYWVIGGGACERRGGADKCHSGAGGHNNGAPRTLEEEEAGLCNIPDVYFDYDIT